MSATIEDAVRDYLEGMCRADEARLRAAFHPAAAVVGHYEGALEWLSLDEFVASCRAAGALPADADYHWKVLARDETGDVATVKLEDDYLGARFTDYLTLINHEGRWQIVNKTYHLHGAP